MIGAGECALKGYLIECRGPLHGHHLISKNMARGNPEVRDLLRTCPALLMSDVCTAHNVGKMADSHNARRILLLQKIAVYGYAYMQAYIDGLPWKVKSQSLTLAAMLEEKETKT